MIFMWLQAFGNIKGFSFGGTVQNSFGKRFPLTLTMYFVWAYVVLFRKPHRSLLHSVGASHRCVDAHNSSVFYCPLSNIFWWRKTYMRISKWRHFKLTITHQILIQVLFDWFCDVAYFLDIHMVLRRFITSVWPFIIEFINNLSLLSLV